MVRRWRAFSGAGLCGALLVGACSGGQSGGEVTTNEPEPPPSQGAPECVVTEDCRARVESQLQGLARPEEPDVRINMSRCMLFGAGEAYGPACRCQGWDRFYWLGPEGSSCYFLGRTGNCLFAGSEFTACDLYDDSACDAPCAELERRLNEDRAREVATELLEVECVDQHCYSVVSLDGRCYVNNDYTSLNRSYDCALDSSSVLEQRASCGSCPQYDQCIARAITCNARGLIDEPGCGCP